MGNVDFSLHRLSDYSDDALLSELRRVASRVAPGLTARPASARYSDEECYENLLRVWTHLGRQPKYREMSCPPSEIGGKAYEGRWGSWVRALEAFVDRVNQDDASMAAAHKTREAVGQSALPNIVAGDDGCIRLGLRYRTLVRDKFKCVLCGNSPARDPSCRLHVDHIHPRSKGGPTVIENLRTLCDACKVGKGNLTIEETS